MSLLICPICGQPLDLDARTRRCASGHAYDRAAKGGYVHLLRQNRRGSATPGDSPEMCAMRTRFLEGGFYAPLRNVVAEEVRALAPRTVLDVGCGEGYYTAAMCQALAGLPGHAIAGIDLAKAALRHAGRTCPNAELAVASLFELPLADGSCELVTSLFTPLCAAEFARVLAPGGTLLTVTPDARHLWGLKQALYAEPYENDTAVRRLDGLVHMRREILTGEIELHAPADIQALYRMTPYAWKTGREAAERLFARQHLETETGFLLDFYTRA